MIPLQAFNMSTCAWDLAESTDDAITDFVIFVGDTVQHITAKYYRALLHRVVRYVRDKRKKEKERKRERERERERERRLCYSPH